MSTSEKINLWQTIFTCLAMLASFIAVWLAYRIGKKQNEINARFLGINDYADIFLMPQQVKLVPVDGTGEIAIGSRLLIKNASSYPVYLNAYTLNGIKHEVGSSIIPVNSENWYGVPIPVDVEKGEKLYMVVEFEDFLSKKYKTEVFGKFDGVSWEVKSNKRVPILFF